ncbi:MAG: hypothetical protein H7301_02175 [Cryobacterium sp.]|nr:hypothetical protein [Oligoflexia bacterium]
MNWLIEQSAKLSIWALFLPIIFALAFICPPVFSSANAALPPLVNGAINHRYSDSIHSATLEYSNHREDHHASDAASSTEKHPDADSDCDFDFGSIFFVGWPMDEKAPCHFSVQFRSFSKPAHWVQKKEPELFSVCSAMPHRPPDVA